MDDVSASLTKPRPCSRPMAWLKSWLPARGASAAASTTFESHYAAHEVLGSGSFATVYRCVEKEDGGVYAVKVIRMGSLSRVERDNLDEEVSLLRRCNHEAIVHLKETFFAPGPPEDLLNVVTEIIRGGDLFDELVATDYDAGPYDESHARTMVGEVLDAVEYLHERGVVHRDIKPENIMLCRHPGHGDPNEPWARVKLVDFGIACELHDHSTRIRGRFGTPLYMAPEIVRGDTKGYDEKVDVWSLGVLVYLLMCGAPPVAPAAMEDAHPGQLDEIFTSIKAFKRVKWEPAAAWSGISKECKDFIRKSLTLDPLKRFSAHDLRHHDWVAHAGHARGAAAGAKLKPKVAIGAAARARNHTRFATLRAGTLRGDSDTASSMTAAGRSSTVGASGTSGTLRFMGSATLRDDGSGDGEVGYSSAVDAARLATTLSVRHTCAGKLSKHERTSVRAKRELLVELSKAMRALGRKSARGMSTAHVLAAATRFVRRVVDAERGTVWLVDEVAGELWATVAEGIDVEGDASEGGASSFPSSSSSAASSSSSSARSSSSMRKRIRVPISSASIAGHVALTGKPVNTADAYTDARFDQRTDARTGFRTRAMLTVPIMKRQPGRAKPRVFGVMQMVNKEPGTMGLTSFSADDIDRLKDFGTHVACALSALARFKGAAMKVRHATAFLKAASPSSSGSGKKGKKRAQQSKCSGGKKEKGKATPKRRKTKGSK